MENDWKLDRINLDYANMAIIQPLYASPEDMQGRGIELHVTSDGEPINLTGKKVLFAWRNESSRKEGVAELSADDAAHGIFTMTYPSRMQTPGIAIARILIYEGAELQVSSRPFEIDVEKRIIDNSNLFADNDFSMFLFAIDEMDTATEDAIDATGKANEAASAANKAAGDANTAKSNADAATKNANDAAGAANTAKNNADAATKKANDAATKATNSAAKADEAAASATSSATAAGAAATAANNAASAANTAAGRANSAADEAEAFLNGFTVEYDNLSEECKDYIAQSAAAGVEFATQDEIDKAFEDEILPVLAGGEMDNALTPEEFEWAISDIFA